MQLDGAELDAFLKNVGREFRERSDIAAADIDPVHHDDHEADQAGPLWRVDRRIHRDVVEMLTDSAGVVGDDDIAVEQLILP